MEGGVGIAVGLGVGAITCPDFGLVIAGATEGASAGAAGRTLAMDNGGVSLFGVGFSASLAGAVGAEEMAAGFTAGFAMGALAVVVLVTA